jgi:glutamate synthase domain-containing protein 2/glutamate synthase domain-containing protein 1/glutamate synthase domain-containing protein 3
VRHRGAVAADRLTGDGAGVLLPIPPALLPRPWCGMASVFLRDDAARTAIEEACEAEGIEVVGWRPVPVDESALGASAQATAPRIEHLFFQRPFGVNAVEAELRAFRARKRAERAPGAYIASFSFRTVTYKALCAADQLAEYFPDLRDPSLAVPFAIFHQRFSTNTSPSWERAQPFRMLCHNGEINTIDGNVNSMRAREGNLGFADEELLTPVIDPEGSDSAKLDNALELLVRGGREVRHAMAMLIPAAWENDPELGEDVAAFYRYQSLLVEPWDGPAGIVFTDGRVVGASLDRNGLRPLRYAVCDNGLVVCSSEAGAVPLPKGVRVQHGKLAPGDMIAVDRAGAGFQSNTDVKRRLARRRPYRAWLEHLRPVMAGEPSPSPGDDLTRRQILFGYTREELSVVLRPIAAHAHEPISSMGDDTALPLLAGRARPLFSYFRQRFAQVTNPAIDHLRERGVMSLRTLLGKRAPLLSDGPHAARLLELESFFLFPSALVELDALSLDTTFDGRDNLARAVERLAERAIDAVRSGATIVLLTDENAGADRAPIPSLLAVGGVHHRLVAAGLRSSVSLVVVSDEPREAHHMACLLGYGADAICPRLALQSVAAMAAADKVGGDHPTPIEAQLRFRDAVEDAVLKIMSKMGISSVASYRGAQIFEAIGLSREVVDHCFSGTPAPIGGLGFAEIEHELFERLAASENAKPQLENPGYVKFRKGGEPHAMNPEVVESMHEMAAAHALRKSLNGAGRELYDRFAGLVNGRAPMELRDLLETVVAPEPVPLDEVESAESIVQRFSSGGMSLGALSPEAHETISIAFNRLRARSNSGEGGEDRLRYRTERNSRIKQIASGRFGVTPEYAVFADELQIKVSQGSKPGEGGQIPAHKVTEEIAALRRTQPGVSLISPPPHHDIYSIEDLAQLVFDLRQVSPKAAVSVKLVAEAGVGLVAAGVVKALADVVHIAGADGGTGASPLSSIKNAGAPWELGLAETQQTLVAEGLRTRVRLRVDGGLKTGRDVVVAALLGADEVSFGTALLLAEGCLMVRSCHLDTCPVGIATQRPELRSKFIATPEQVMAYLLYVAEEARELLASLGLRSFDDAVGRTDLLRARTDIDERAATIDVRPLLARFDGDTRYAGEHPAEAIGGELGERLAADAAPALRGETTVELEYDIRNGDRTVGARLGGLIAEQFGESAPPGSIHARFTGDAGQSFGAFLSAGVELDLTGLANDYVGKSMAGGRIVLRPPVDSAPDPVLAGNTVLYGATGGDFFCAGRAGERFAVRNSGAVAVVEGVGDHACEYMTSGTVAVLGPYGRNVGAGMSGGEIFVHDPANRLAVRLNGELVAIEPLCEEDADRLRALVEQHVELTGSVRGSVLLEDWDAAVAVFRRVAPTPAVGARLEVAEEAAD